jgi:hypothetical protein
MKNNKYLEQGHHHTCLHSSGYLLYLFLSNAGAPIYIGMPIQRWRERLVRVLSKEKPACHRQGCHCYPG